MLEVNEQEQFLQPHHIAIAHRHFMSANVINTSVAATFTSDPRPHPTFRMGLCHSPTTATTRYVPYKQSLRLRRACARRPTYSCSRKRSFCLESDLGDARVKRVASRVPQGDDFLQRHPFECRERGAFNDPMCPRLTGAMRPIVM